MSTFILITLFVALVAYTVTGGADFGVGIVEMLAPASARKRIRKLSERAIAPIWEANHVWIVLILVVLFVGFPDVHTALVTSMHIPLLIMLVGIVLRGTAFTFRYYDLGSDPTSEKLWTWLFRLGSLLVPLSFGAIAGALHRGKLPRTPTTVWESYLAPWMTTFSLATGVFTALLFAWIAVVFLCGELDEEDDHEVWRKRAQRYGVATMIAGAGVSALAASSGVLDVNELFSPIALVSLAVASAALALVATQVGRRIWLPRLAVAAAATSILAGYWLAHYPVALRFGDGELLWSEALAPEASLRSLSVALVFGLLVIGPGLGYLYRVFKKTSSS